MQQVPAIDRLAGIECYCTQFLGVGGSIKQNSEKFKVSEIVDKSFFMELSPRYDSAHRFPLYLLEKTGVDSNHAVIEIERRHRIKLLIMGIKDAKASTKQYAGSQHALSNPPSNLTTEHTQLSLQGFTRKPITRKSLSGNHFEIIVDDGKSDSLPDFLPELDKIANFYGLQRFGSARLVTHLVGREIVRKNFKRAVELLLTFTTEYDTAFSQEIRHDMEDPKNYQKVLGKIPRGMDIERLVLSELVKGSDYIKALRSIPLAIRRLYVQSFQAFIFNKCLSQFVASSVDINRPAKGDLCFEMESDSTFGRVLKYDPDSRSKLVPAVRLAGFAFQEGRGRFEQATSFILHQEGLSPKDFYVKEMDELSQQGGFRQAPLHCMNFSYKSDPLQLSFDLPKGSYATVLLRELMKPAEPISNGF